MNENYSGHDLRGAPPRQLTILSQIKVLFGGFHFVFGSVFFWFGMIFTQVFVLQSDFVYLFSFDGEWIEAEGMLTSIEETNASENEQDIYEYTFSYVTKDGQSVQASSYSTYKSIALDSPVKIEYKSKNPNRARIVGMSSSMMSMFVGFVLIFPIIGFIFMIISIRENKKALYLLRNGLFTRGKMIGYEATNTSINERTVYAYEFAFSANGKSCIATGKTHLTERVEDEALEKILYHPIRPEENIIYDTFTNLPKIDKFGKFEQANITALSSLLPTIIGLIINGAIYVLIF